MRVNHTSPEVVQRLAEQLNESEPYHIGQYYDEGSTRAVYLCDGWIVKKANRWADSHVKAQDQFKALNLKFPERYTTESGWNIERRYWVAQSSGEFIEWFGEDYFDKLNECPLDLHWRNVGLDSDCNLVAFDW